VPRAWSEVRVPPSQALFSERGVGLSLAYDQRVAVAQGAFGSLLSLRLGAGRRRRLIAGAARG
jgi:hypothetical protein